jgi:RHS repeat-associated protein
MTGADITTASGTTHETYQYDADGNRVSMTSNGVETRYLIDTVQPYAQVLLEYRPSGLIVASYAYGNSLISQSRGGVLSYYQKDGLGSTRALTNASGVVTDRYTYDAFGRMLAQTGSTVNSYLFAGQQRDVMTGLDYLRARWLNPASGRFMSQDTFPGALHNPIMLNRYMYAGGNPINAVDPGGMQFDLVGLADSLSILSTLLDMPASSFSAFTWHGLGLSLVNNPAFIVSAGYTSTGHRFLVDFFFLPYVAYIASVVEDLNVTVVVESAFRPGRVFLGGGIYAGKEESP